MQDSVEYGWDFFSSAEQETDRRYKQLKAETPQPSADIQAVIEWLDKAYDFMDKEESRAAAEYGLKRSCYIDGMKPALRSALLLVPESLWAAHCAEKNQRLQQAVLGRVLQAGQDDRPETPVHHVRR